MTQKILWMVLLLPSLAWAWPGVGEVTINVPLTEGAFKVKGKVKGYAKYIKDRLRFSPMQVPVKMLSSGIDLRDEHMHKKFKSPEVVISNIKANSKAAAGTIAINGVTKPVATHRFEILNDRVCGAFDVNFTEFNMEKENFNGIGVLDTVLIEACVPLRASK